MTTILKKFKKVMLNEKKFILILFAVSTVSYLLGHYRVTIKDINPALFSYQDKAKKSREKSEIIKEIKQARQMFDFNFSHVMLEKIQYEIPKYPIIEDSIYDIPDFWETLEFDYQENLSEINRKHEKLFYDFYEPYSQEELEDYLLVHKNQNFALINKRFGREMLDVSNHSFESMRSEMSEEMRLFVEGYLNNTYKKNK